MRTFSLARSFLRTGVLLVLLGPASLALAQDFSLQFPATQQTSITDCSTPTMLNLPGGGTVTLVGGQFIHYTDANFDGTIYATSSAAGCGRLTPLIHGNQAPVVIMTFSQPVGSFTLPAYNFVGEYQYLGMDVYDATGNNQGSQTGGFPTFTQMPYPLFWPVFSSSPSTGSIELFPYSTNLQPDYTYNPPNWAWGLTSLQISQSAGAAGDFVRFDFSESMSGTNDSKVLLSVAPWDLVYPSQYQLHVAGAPQVKVSGTLIDGQTKQPKAGTVYLRVDDPADTAPYRGSDAAAGDNDGPAAQLSGAAGNGIATLQTDGQGKFEATMTITSHVAGDNYQLAGSANAAFTCPGGPCPKSGVFTVWKRVYVEQENMFKQGSFLNGIADAGKTEIPVADPGPFQSLPAGTTLELIHADSGIGEGFYFDFVTFKSIQQRPNGKWIIDIDPSFVTMHDYGAPPPSGTAAVADDILRDGVGIVNVGTYEANDTYVAFLFNLMFVELKSAKQTVTEVPYVAELGPSVRTDFADLWLQNVTTTSPYTRRASPNVYHRIAIAQMPLVYKTGRTGGAELGQTAVVNETNWSFIMAKRIEDVTAGNVIDKYGSSAGAEYFGLNSFVVNGETTAHETVHFWVHAPMGVDGTGHCAEHSYANSQLNCLMHTPYVGPGLGDGIVDLHYVAHGSDSEYMTVRRAADPVPQQ